MRPIRGFLPIALVAGLLSPTAAVAAQTQAAPWKPYTAFADGFHAEFPSDPEVGKTSVPVGKDTFELHSYQVQVGSTALYIGVCDYGAKGLAADPDEMVASAKTGAVAHMSARVMSQEKLSAGHGVAFEAESDKLHFSVRMYMAGSMLYQAMVASPLNNRYADAARFLDSFQLLPHTKAANSIPAVSTPDWKPYTYRTDGFSASFPSPPTIEKQNVNSSGGAFELRTYEADDSATALIAAVCDYGATAASKDPDAVLDDAKKGAVNNIKGQLVSEKKINLGVNHGVEFEADSDSAHVTARIYLVGSVLYQVIVAAPLKTKYADTSRFLDSFQLFDRTGN
ncbi:MAG: hypothetical protein ABSG96_06755 [Terracidiphilus sp.]|jgi:hypothetical protein